MSFPAGTYSDCLAQVNSNIDNVVCDCNDWMSIISNLIKPSNSCVLNINVVSSFLLIVIFFMRFSTSPPQLVYCCKWYWRICVSLGRLLRGCLCWHAISSYLQWKYSQISFVKEKNQAGSLLWILLGCHNVISAFSTMLVKFSGVGSQHVLSLFSSNFCLHVGTSVEFWKLDCKFVIWKLSVAYFGEVNIILKVLHDLL